MCMVYCNSPKVAKDFNENITCNCELQQDHEGIEREYFEAQIGRAHPTISEYLRDPAFLILSICMFVVLMVTVALVVILLKMKRKRPRINKRIIVNKSVTPLTSGPQTSIDQCEITIENCCNMNLCETPCFEPPQLRKSKKANDEKKKLLKNMETGDDLY